MLQIVPTNKVKLFKFCLKTPSLVQIEKKGKDLTVFTLGSLSNNDSDGYENVS